MFVDKNYECLDFYSETLCVKITCIYTYYVCCYNIKLLRIHTELLYLGSWLIF